MIATSNQIKNLSLKDKFDLIEALEAKLDKQHAKRCKESFFYFVQQFWSVVSPEKPVWNWHIKALCDDLQIAMMRICQIQNGVDENDIPIIVKDREEKLYDEIINVPPGTSKSTIFTIMAPAWIWTIDTTIRTLTASYSASLSIQHSIKSRDIIKSDNYLKWFPDVKIKFDQDNKAHYKNTKGGERYATSVTGTVTGFHAHLIIVDDPINRLDAEGEGNREKANDFVTNTLSTRKVDERITLTLLVMQRLNEDDPTGRLLFLNQDKIRHICLPAEFDDNISPVEWGQYYINGLLDPIRKGIIQLEQQKKLLGSYGYSGQYGQRPAPKGGVIWQKWFIELEDDIFPSLDDMQDVGNDWDLAYTEEDKNAASAYMRSGKIENKMYIDAFDFAYKEFPDLINWMKLQYPVHYIEAKASGKSAKQTLTKSGVPAIEVQVIGGDKVARARMATPFAESGMVYIRKSIANRLYNEVDQGILNFPNSKKKDVADILAQAIQRHFSNTIYSWSDSGWGEDAEKEKDENEQKPMGNILYNND